MYTVLYSNYANLFWEMMRQRLAVSTLVFGEVSYIRPRVPYPAQANEHLSQPPSACIIPKLDFTAKETFTAALPPSGL